MKKILGLDLGTTSIGWALVNEADNSEEKSEIIKLGVRVNPLTVDELSNFEKGKSITTTADRTLKRSMRRNLQRYKLRREELIKILKENNFISDSTVLSEEGNHTTFQTYRLRAKAVNEKISLEELAKVLLMINKKRGYKSSRKAKSTDEGALIDGMEVAKILYNEDITPSQLCLRLIREGKKYLPEFYRSDLKAEFDKIWEYQHKYHSEILTPEFKEQIFGKGKLNTSKTFLAKYNIYTLDIKGKERREALYNLRVDSLCKELSKEELALVISDINGSISNSSGYLGEISDRSKELYFNKLTVGQYLINELDKNPNYSFKNKVFYRQDYLDEFDRIWETQSKFHKVLTDELKQAVRDIIIFYQRRLKSQKGLLSFCELESKPFYNKSEGQIKKKTTGPRVCPRSSPLFQEFKVWQILNNIEVSGKSGKSKRYNKDFEKRPLLIEEKQVLYNELCIKEKLSKEEALKLLFVNSSDLDLNYLSIEGNRTISSFIDVCQRIIELTGHEECNFSKLNAKDTLNVIEEIFKGLGYKSDFLKFNFNLDKKEYENQPSFKLWHLIYSFEGDNSKTGDQSLIEKISEITGVEKEFAKLFANISFTDDYSSLSSKAIRKLLPYMKEGSSYDIACLLAGYKSHSKSSLTKEELESKRLLDKLEILPKNSLRNPVVEKILNQMVNVINQVIDTYGKPDEIRIELARELKKNAKQREELTKIVSQQNAEHEKIKKIIQQEFGSTYVSRNDIIRYKLYEELKLNGYHTLYSNQYIPREKIFSKEYDIEHIIPQSKLFDDSFSNKTLELRSINIEKGNRTAYDFVYEKYGEDGIHRYLSVIEKLKSSDSITRTKAKKLTIKESEIPEDFIERDLRDSQYIAKKAKDMLLNLVKTVISTSGSITDRLREDWQLVDVLKELNWDKYNALGLTEIIDGRDGQRIYKIKDWTKRNDHRHHAMDALTVAFTRLSHIQYLNNLSAKSDKAGSIYGIAQKELEKDSKGKLRFKSPIPLEEFRAEAKMHLENVLISIKAKSKVVTKNINKTKTNGGYNKKVQLTPRGQLHNETIYGSSQKYKATLLKINGSFNTELIEKVSKKIYREALLKRLSDFDNDPKKAFTGKNSIDKNPIYLDESKTIILPEKVKIVEFENIFTIRKEVSPDLNIEKVLDPKVKEILKLRLIEYQNDAKKAFSNLDENPIWLNKNKGISIKRVTITGVNNAVALHDKRDKNGELIFDQNGNKQPVDFVNTGNNHHVAIYKDADGNLQEEVVSFFEATMRATQGMPIIDKQYKQSEGWTFLFSMKQNEYFVFPNEKTGFNPNEIDLLDPSNYKLISPNLFRVQTISKVEYGNAVVRDYQFRHHLETNVNKNSILKDITYKSIKSLYYFNNVVKVKLNHIGKIIFIGESND